MDWLETHQLDLLRPKTQLQIYTNFKHSKHQQLIMKQIKYQIHNNSSKYINKIKYHRPTKFNGKTKTKQNKTKQKQNKK